MKLYAKIRKKLICVLVGIFTVCLFFAFVMSNESQSKYVFEASDPDAKIEISVQNQVEISSVAQFITAIENGYSNIKIADAVANPLLFMSDELDLKADLVIDLNGHELQRSGSDAMVNVPEGVTLTVYDSDSADPDSLASLYNPIGSVIDVKGGNLSLVGGKVESGVRANEYSTYSGETHGTVGDTLDTATLYTKYVNGASVSDDGYTLTDDGYYAQSNATLPKISAATITSGNYTLKDGNIYVPAGKTLSSDSYSYYTFETNNPLGSGGDYYLYYMNESNTYTAVSSGSADFYYEYEDDDGEQITICGFYKNFKTANLNDTTYATVVMESGTLSVFGGEYYQYFGVNDAYCVYATGGDMTVFGGAFVAEGYSTCLGCNFKGTADKGTLKVNAGEFTSYLGDGIRVSGYATEETDADDMTVTGGSFIKIAEKPVSVGGQEAEKLGVGYSSNGSAINMVSGKLTITGASEQSQDDLVKFNVYGGGINGIKCGEGAFVYSTNAEFLFNCDYQGNMLDSDGTSPTTLTWAQNIGILNYEGVVKVENNLFRLNCKYDVGIYSVGDGFFNEDYDFDHTANANASVTAVSTIFSMTGESNVGVLATRGKVTLGSEDSLGVEGEDRYALFYIDHVADCFGVYVAEVDKDADVGSEQRGLVELSGDDNQLQTDADVVSYAAQFFMGQEYYNDEDENAPPENSYYTSETVGANSRIFNGCGIYLNGKDSTSTITLYRTILFSAGSYTAGIFVRNGTVEQGVIGGKAYKYASLMGVTVNKYLAGGQYNTDDTTGDHSLDSVDGHFRNKFGMYWYVAQYGADNYTSEQIFDVAQANAKACQGLITFGGDIILYNCFLGIYSTWSSGIYSSGGKVDIRGYSTNGDEFSNEGFECKLITLGATSADDSTANADIDPNTNISSPFSYSENYTGTKIEGNRLITSCVVRMNVTGSTTDTENSGSTAADTSNRVYIAAGKITTDNYGFYIEGGNLYFGSEYSLGTTQITGYRAPAIVLKGGNITVYEDDGLIINDTLNTAGKITYTDADGNAKTLTGDYKDFTSSGTIVTDAVYVSGGSFTANGTLDITFAGLENDTGYNTIYDFAVKSYALRVTSDSANTGDDTGGADTYVLITKGNITSSIGGGVYVNNGDLTLGSKSRAVDELTVTTTGTKTDGIQNTDGSFASNSNWHYQKSLEGGHAISVEGGKLTVYGGTYSAAQGNGIMIKNGTCTIYAGTFDGKDSYSSGSSDQTYGAGPDASYCLKMFGGSLTVENGTFNGDNSVLLLGITSESKVTADIKRGNFTSTVGAAICIYDNVKITLGEESAAGKLNVIGASSAFTIENLKNKEDSSTLALNGDILATVNSGYYECTRNVTNRWTNAIYYDSTLAVLNIKDGYFQSIYGYGVFINHSENIDAKYINIYGGTFKAKEHTFYMAVGSGSENTTELLSNIIDLDKYELWNESNETITTDSTSTISSIGTNNTYIQVVTKGWNYSTDDNGYGTLTLVNDVSSTYSQTFDEYTLYSFDYSVNGGTLTISYTDYYGAEQTQTISSGEAYTGASILIKAGTSLTFKYVSGASSGDTGEFAKISNIKAESASDTYTRSTDYDSYTQGTGDFTVGETTYTGCTTYTSTNGTLTYYMYNASFNTSWSGNSKISSDYNTSSAVIVYANADSLVYSGSYGTWDDAVDGGTNSATVYYTVYYAAGGVKEEGSVTGSTYGSLNVTLSKGEYIVFTSSLSGGTSLKFDIQSIDYTAIVVDEDKTGNDAWGTKVETATEDETA